MFYKNQPSNIRVALLAGGTSGEREISLASGKGAAKALKEAGYQVDLLDPADKDDLKRLIDGGFDVAFLCTHGKGGEDGTLQGFLETVGLPYTGSGVWGSAVSMDKSKAKVFYELAGIPTPSSIVLHRGDEADAGAVVRELGEKCAVKAATEGSSIGVYIVEGCTAIEQAIHDAFEYDDSVVVERYIKGTELTVVVLDGEGGPEAMPIIEIIPQSESYDFESKYAPGGSQHICPARIPADAAQRIQAHAVAAHKALGCSGVSRSDFILEPDGNAWILETNTLPGMTETSLLPDAARAAGVSFPALCTLLVDDALRGATTCDEAGQA